MSEKLEQDLITNKIELKMRPADFLKAVGLGDRKGK